MEESKSTALIEIVKESKLEATKAQYILDNFQDYFQIAAEWEAKAKTLVVTREDQEAEMQMARTGRLFLREKRIAIENSRKKLKEESLREGKAIDGIANVLKALIVPIEEYLDKQEHFVELIKEKKDAEHRAEIERRMEEERIAKEKAEAEEREKIRLDNERLKKEAVEKDRLAAEERKKQDAILAEERAKSEAERKRQDEILAAERKKADEERKKQDAVLEEERQKAAAEKKAAEDKARTEKEKAEAERKKADEEARKKLEAEQAEKKRLEELLKNQVECPNCKVKFQLERKA
jgi:hypothetical protein